MTDRTDLQIALEERFLNDRLEEITAGPRPESATLRFTHPKTGSTVMTCSFAILQKTVKDILETDDFDSATAYWEPSVILDMFMKDNGLTRNAWPKVSTLEIPSSWYQYPVSDIEDDSEFFPEKPHVLVFANGWMVHYSLSDIHVIVATLKCTLPHYRPSDVLQAFLDNHPDPDPVKTVVIDSWADIQNRFHEGNKDTKLYIGKPTALEHHANLSIGVDPAQPESDHTALTKLDYSKYEERILAHSFTPNDAKTLNTFLDQVETVIDTHRKSLSKDHPFYRPFKRVDGERHRGTFKYGGAITGRLPAKSPTEPNPPRCGPNALIQSQAAYSMGAKAFGEFFKRYSDQDGNLDFSDVRAKGQSLNGDGRTAAFAALYGRQSKRYADLKKAMHEQTAYYDALDALLARVEDHSSQSAKSLQTHAFRNVFTVQSAPVTVMLATPLDTYPNRTPQEALTLLTEFDRTKPPFSITIDNHGENLRVSFPPKGAKPHITPLDPNKPSDALQLSKPTQRFYSVFDRTGEEALPWVMPNSSSYADLKSDLDQYVVITPKTGNRNPGALIPQVGETFHFDPKTQALTRIETQKETPDMSVPYRDPAQTTHDVFPNDIPNNTLTAFTQLLSAFSGFDTQRLINTYLQHAYTEKHPSLSICITTVQGKQILTLAHSIGELRTLFLRDRIPCTIAVLDHATHTKTTFFPKDANDRPTRVSQGVFMETHESRDSGIREDEDAQSVKRLAQEYEALNNQTLGQKVLETCQKDDPMSPEMRERWMAFITKDLAKADPIPSEYTKSPELAEPKLESFSEAPFKLIRDYLAACRLLKGLQTLDTLHKCSLFRISYSISQEKNVYSEIALKALKREINDFATNSTEDTHNLRADFQKPMMPDQPQNYTCLVISSDFGHFHVTYEPDVTELEWETRFKDLKRTSIHV